MPAGTPPRYEREPAGPAEIRVGGYNDLIRASILWSLLGFLFASMVVVVATSGRWRVVLTLGVLGLAAVCLAVIVAHVHLSKKVLRIDGAGLTCRGRRGATLWSVSWAEIAAVVVTTAHRVNRGTWYYRMRLMLVPRRPTGDLSAAPLVAREPRLAAWRGRYGARPGDFGVPLARYSELPRLDAALRTFAELRYRGIVHEGLFSMDALD